WLPRRRPPQLSVKVRALSCLPREYRPPQQAGRRAGSDIESRTPPPSPSGTLSPALALKSRPKPLTPVNREPLVLQQKSRIYLQCGEAITHATDVIKFR